LGQDEIVSRKRAKITNATAAPMIIGFVAGWYPLLSAFCFYYDASAASQDREIGVENS
jgi:hypothetical protein